MFVLKVFTEGNLLLVDLLQRIAEGDRDLKKLIPDAHHLSKNERLEEILNRPSNQLKK